MSVIGRWESRERSSWWVFVLWSVTARKSSPRSIALATSSSTVFSPSEWIVWQWRSPFSQRARPPERAGPLPRRRRVALVQGEVNHHLVAYAFGVDPLDAQHDLPVAGVKGATDVSGRRLLGRDEELALGGAAPAAEAGGGQGPRAPRGGD